MTRDEQWLLDEKYGGVATSEFEKDCERLKDKRPFGRPDAGEPLAYVIGWQPFLGLKIFLDSKPLIPRPETEWWIEQLLSEQTGNTVLRASASADERHEQIFSRKLCVPQNSVAGLRILDLCAGSGAIGCATLVRLPDAQVYFGEVDPAHEATIQKNISENNLEASRAHVCIGDLFEPFADMEFDLIAVNPPYIPSARPLDASVASHEPALALYAGEDGLDLIRRIAKELPRHLAAGGKALIECDSTHATPAQSLFTEQNLYTEIRTDQFGRPRLIVVSFK